MEKVQILSNEVVFCTDHTNKARLWSLCSNYKDWWHINTHKQTWLCYLIQDLVADVRLPFSECKAVSFFRNFLHSTCLTPFLKEEGMVKAPANAGGNAGVLFSHPWLCAPGSLFSSGWFWLKLASTATANFSPFIPFTLSRKLLKLFYSTDYDLDLYVRKSREKCNHVNLIWNPPTENMVLNLLQYLLRMMQWQS